MVFCGVFLSFISFAKNVDVVDGARKCIINLEQPLYNTETSMHAKEELLEKCFECFCRNGKAIVIRVFGIFL